MRSIDQEINFQSQNMQKIRSQLNEEHNRGSSFQSRFKARSQNHSQNQNSQGQLRQADRSRTSAVSQKIEALASLHRDLNGVTAGIDALYEQYPLLNSWISLDQYQRAAFQTEEHLQAARRLYNSNVSLYNQTFEPFHGPLSPPYAAWNRPLSMKQMRKNGILKRILTKGA